MTTGNKGIASGIVVGTLALATRDSKESKTLWVYRRSLEMKLHYKALLRYTFSVQTTKEIFYIFSWLRLRKLTQGVS